jgi:hypothetical protein
LSEKTIAAGGVECIDRTTGKSTFVPESDIVEYARV